MRQCGVDEGAISSAIVGATRHAIDVVNACTQFDWRGRKPFADYSGKRIAYPKIGAGLAGSDWSVISAIIDEELAGLQHALVEYDG